MAGGTTTDRGKTQDLAGIEPGGLGRRQLIGDQDRPFGQLHRLILHAEDQLQHPLADIRQVRRPLGQQRIAQAFEQRCRRLGRGAPGKRRALAFADQRMGLIQQARVFEQFLMGLEDLCLGIPGGLVTQKLQGQIRLGQGTARVARAQPAPRCRTRSPQASASAICTT